jgi:hypothetical protein
MMIGKNLEGSGSDLIEIASQNLASRTEKGRRRKFQLV